MRKQRILQLRKAKAKKAATASKNNAKIDIAAKKAADVKVSEEKATANEADIIRQRKEAEKQDKIDAKKKRKAQAALEAKRVTPNRMLQELDDEIGIGPFKKGENFKVFISMFANYLSLGLQLRFLAREMTYFRERMTVNIIDGLVE